MSLNPDQYGVVAIAAGISFLVGALVAWLITRSAARRAGRASRDVEVSQLAGERDANLETRRRLQQEQEFATRELAESRRKSGEISEQRAALEGRLERLSIVESELAAARGQVSHWNEACQRAEQRLTEALTRLQEAADRESLLKQVREDFADRFKTLSGEVLDQQTQKFTEQNQNNLGTLLNPLREQLGDFRKRVDEVYDKESRERDLLKAEIDSLKDLNKTIGAEALNLTRALKGESQVRGSWGEMVLERLLELSGLQAGRQYETQVSYRNEEGTLKRPDVVVRLPASKDIIVDSKVSLVDWDRYVSAIEDEERGMALKKYVSAVRRRVDELSSKDYSGIEELHTVEFVLLFVPIEAAFIEAIRHDVDLYGYALARKVSLVGPSTLLTTLQTVAHLWRMEQRSVNSMEFVKSAALLHDNFALLIEGIQDVGEKLDKAQTSHSGLLRRLTEGGRGSVLLQVQRLKELGASVKKSLPQSLLGRAGDSESGDEQGDSESDSSTEKST